MPVKIKPFGACSFLGRQPGQRPGEVVFGGFHPHQPQMHLPVIKLGPAASLHKTVLAYIQRYNTDVATLTFEQARQCVLKELRASQPDPKIELTSLSEAAGRVLAEPISADRDYPALARSVRDGFAARAADLPGGLL